MRVYLIFIVLAVVSALFAIGLLSASFSQVTTTSFAIPPGSYCAYHRFETITGGTVTITFNATPGTVQQYVFTDAQHSAFFAGTGDTSLATDTGSSGTFTANLPSGGTYYVDSCHGAGYDSVQQTGLHTITVNAPLTGPFIAGVGGLLAAIVFLIIGLWMRRRPQAPAVPPMAPAVGPAGFGTIVLSVENATSVDETVQVLLNGAPVGSLPVPAGQTAQATLHPPLGNAYGSPVRVEAVMTDGRRATQDMTATAFQGLSMKLRIAPPAEGADVAPPAPPSPPPGPAPPAP